GESSAAVTTQLATMTASKASWPAAFAPGSSDGQNPAQVSSAHQAVERFGHVHGVTGNSQLKRLGTWSARGPLSELSRAVRSAPHSHYRLPAGGQPMLDR